MTNRYKKSATRLFLMPLVWAVAILLAGSATTSAQTAGPNNAGSAAVESANPNSQTWSNLTNIYSSNDNRATSTLPGGSGAGHKYPLSI
jgi:hypothetical protein